MLLHPDLPPNSEGFGGVWCAMLVHEDIGGKGGPQWEEGASTSNCYQHPATWQVSLPVLVALGSVLLSGPMMCGTCGG